jgi:hypothetical protein
VAQGVQTLSSKHSTARKKERETLPDILLLFLFYFTLGCFHLFDFQKRKNLTSCFARWGVSCPILFTKGLFFL